MLSSASSDAGVGNEAAGFAFEIEMPKSTGGAIVRCIARPWLAAAGAWPGGFAAGPAPVAHEVVEGGDACGGLDRAAEVATVF